MLVVKFTGEAVDIPKESFGCKPQAKGIIGKGTVNKKNEKKILS